MSRPHGKIRIECAHDKIVPLSQLKERLANPNTHSLEQIKLLAKIIKVSGWRNPIVVSNLSGLITKGHARFKAATLLGEKTAPVDYQNYASESEEIADVIADNRIAELAELDRSLLRELAEQLDDGAFDMDLTGFDQKALEELMTATAPESDVDAEPQIDKAAELAEKWGVKRGQVWELGDHRVMCGDATASEDVVRITANEQWGCMVTDPPYGVDYEGGLNTKKRKKISGDSTVAIYESFLPQWEFSRGSKGVLYLWFAGCNGLVVYGAVEKLGYDIRALLIWNKIDPHYGAFMAQYMQKHEPCLYCVKDGTDWSGPSNEVTVWDIKQPHRNEHHPTQKPVECFTRSIRNSTKARAIIADPFLGSGTAIIACEQLGRKCRAMEIDPGYVAVSIQRWADATGKAPKLL